MNARELNVGYTVRAYETKAEDVQFGQKFVNTDGSIYTIECINTNTDRPTVYASTDAVDKPDGWFDREYYYILKAEKGEVQRSSSKSDTLVGIVSLDDQVGEEGYPYADDFNPNSYKVGSWRITKDRINYVKTMFKGRVLTNEQAFVMIRGFSLFEERVPRDQVIKVIKYEIQKLIDLRCNGRDDNLEVWQEYLLILSLGPKQYAKLESMIAEGKEPCLAITPTSLYSNELRIN